MSRVGKKPVELPDGTEASIVANEITIPTPLHPTASS